jgi:hypothetical protein
MANEFQRSPGLDMAKLLDQHWVSDTFITIAVGTIVTLYARQYEAHMYEWAGQPAGLEFRSDRTFAEYENVLCSTETSPVREWGETWRLMDDGTIEVCGPHRRIEFEVLSLTDCCLELQVRAAEDAECEP